MTTWLQDQAELEKLRDERDQAAENLIKAVIALYQIAAPKRPDGTYNRSREACAQLAARTIREIENV